MKKIREFQKPYNEIGHLNHEIIFNKDLPPLKKMRLKRKVNKLMGRRFYKDV